MAKKSPISWELSTHNLSQVPIKKVIVCSSEVLLYHFSNLIEGLSKIRDYHGSYKSISDTFSIDLTEFVQIFGSNESAFVIWDTDDNGLIDALELFCGLIIFSDSKFDDKVRCKILGLLI